jgi:hypothetical protein
MLEEQDFRWQCHPAAEELLLKLLNDAFKKNKQLTRMAQDLERYTSTRLFDWIDHFFCRYEQGLEQSLIEVRFVEENVLSPGKTFHHPGALFPRVVLVDKGKHELGVAVSVENIDDFLMTHRLSLPIEGSIVSSYRRCLISKENGIAFTVIERRGSRTLLPDNKPTDYLQSYLLAAEKWQTRPRDGEDEDKIFQGILDIADEMVSMVGRDVAAHIVMEVERKFWQARNFAGQIQKGRQDRLGMGWANHDHHTFRSSRCNFPKLVQLFETLGFHCREKFYAGEQAGWGAQVMENGNSGHVLFLDLDLSPEEVEIDFAHNALPELPRLGTVGLWCALHGDSILQAGMHHLEAQFNFDDLVKDLKQNSIELMDPFSNFSFLRQAFTKGERWAIDSKRIQRTLQAGYITQEQAKNFRENGAIGSHLENLQRREGFKGFNQDNVSKIIRETDPRNIGA